MCRTNVKHFRTIALCDIPFAKMLSGNLGIYLIPYIRRVSVADLPYDSYPYNAWPFERI